MLIYLGPGADGRHFSELTLEDQEARKTEAKAKKEKKREKKERSKSKQVKNEEIVMEEGVQGSSDLTKHVEVRIPFFELTV